MTAIKSFIEHTFEYVDWNGDSDTVECRVHFTYRRGSPAILWGDNAHPGDPPEVEFDYAEREHWVDGTKRVWNRLKTGEWLEEHCSAWFHAKDLGDIENAALADNEPDSDRGREDRIERRREERERPSDEGDFV